MVAHLLICFTVAISLSTQHLVDTARALPFGPRRDALVAGAETLHEQAATVQLHQPDRFVRWVTGRRQPDPIGADPVAGPEPTLGSAASEAAALTPGAPPPTTTPPATTPPTTAPPTTAETTTTTTGPIRAVSRDDKLRLWAGGDSLGEYVGNQLLFPIADSELTEVVLDYHISTGLARPDYFDWPAQLAAVMDQDQPPDALVFMVGGNDNQDMATGGGVLATGSPEWFAEYRRRVVTLMDATDASTTTSTTSHLFWIGLPPMRDQPRHNLAVEINQILAEEAANRSWVSYIDIVELFSGPDGGFSTHIPDGEGRQRVARAPDGVHITSTGSSWVAERIWAAINQRWTFAGGVEGVEGFEGLSPPQLGS